MKAPPQPPRSRHPQGVPARPRQLPTPEHMPMIHRVQHTGPRCGPSQLPKRTHSGHLPPPASHARHVSAGSRANTGGGHSDLAPPALSHVTFKEVTPRPVLPRLGLSLSQWGHTVFSRTPGPGRVGGLSDPHRGVRTAQPDAGGRNSVSPGSGPQGARWCQHNESRVSCRASGPLPGVEGLLGRASPGLCVPPEPTQAGGRPHPITPGL